MAISDYVNLLPQQADKATEDFFKVASTYSSNRDVLKALGAEDTQKKAGTGLLSSVFKVLGVPGNLVRAGILEATGNPTPELATSKGLDQFLKIVRGDIRVGFGDVAPLKVNPNDPFPKKALKLGAAFIGDVATDPISYISAPGVLTRKAAATVVVNSGSDIAANLRTISPVAAQNIAGLAKNAKPTDLARIQDELGIVSEKGTTTLSDLLKNPAVAKRVEEEQLGNYLAEGLLKSRKELLTRLENITGSKNAALAAFNRLPEEVRGGIVVSGLLGKPVRRADGSMVRLTSGTGEKLGKFGDLLNTGRLASSVSLNPITRVTGKAGDIFAEVKKTLLRNADELPDRDRFIDYVAARNALGEKAAIRAGLQGRALAAANVASNAAKQYGKVGEDNLERKLFDKTFEDTYYSPDIAAPVSANQVQADAAQAAKKLREEMQAIYDEAKKYDVYLGDKTEPTQYTPLVMTDESVKIQRRTDRRRFAKGEYSTEFGRDSFVQFIKDEEVMKRAGYIDPNNPRVIYLNAREVNKLLAERGDFRRFEEDPIKAFAAYAEDMANRIASKRFTSTLEKSGVVVRDVPRIRELLNEEISATFMAGLDAVSPEVRKFAEKRLREVRKQLAKIIDVDNLKEAQAKIAALRAQAKQDFDAATINYTNAREAYRVANDELKVLEPYAPEITRRLKQLRKDFIDNAQNLTDTQRAARQVNARVGRSEVSLENLRREISNAFRRLNRAKGRALTPEDLSFIEERKTLLRLDRDDAKARLAELSDERQIVQDELNLARTERDRLVQEETGTQISATRQFADAVVKRNEAELAMMTSRSERLKAKAKWDNAQADLAFEKIDSIDTIVRLYVRRNARAKQYNAELDVKIDNLIRTGAVSNKTQAKNVLKAEVEESTRLTDEANAAKDNIKETLNYTSQRFEGAAKQYATAILKASEELSEDKFIALQMLKSEAKIAEYIDFVMGSYRDDAAAMAAMGDMYKQWKSIKEVLDTDTGKILSNLEDAQREVLLDNGLNFVKGKTVASKFADRIAQDYSFELINVNSATQDLYATKGVKKFMEQIYKVEQDPTPFEKVISDYLDPLLQLWKTAVTVGRGPGYVATNTIGGMYMNYLGNVSIKNIKLAGKVLLRIDQNLKKIEKANPNSSFAENLLKAEQATSKEFGNVSIGDDNLYNLVTEFFARGAFFDTETQFGLEMVRRGGTAAPEEAFRRTGAIQREFLTEPQTVAEQRYRDAINFLLTNRVQRALNNMAQSSEIFLRLSAFIDGFEKYGNYESALANVHLLHFNYQDLSDAEQWVRRFVPFYTWTRNNIPAQLRAMVMQPGKIQRALYANEEFQNTFGIEGDESWHNQVIPEYINVSDGFASKFTFGDSNIGFFLRLPFEDVNKLFQVKSGVISPRGRELGAMLGPFTTPIEIASGIDLSTGQPFPDKGVAVPEYYKLFSFLPGSDIYRDAEGQLRASAGFAKTIQDTVPAVGTIERAISGSTAIPQAMGADIPEWLVSKEQQKRSLSDFLNVTGIAPAFGYSSATLTPTSYSGELRRRTTRQSADIARYAAEQGVDTDWVRSQLRTGKTPEQIAVLIAAGYGEAKEYESTMQESTRRNYIEKLQGL